MKRSTRLRRARTIIAYWQAGQFVIENYRSGACVNADPLAIKVLHFFEDWRSVSAFFRFMRNYSRESVMWTLRDLLYHTLLVRQGSKAAYSDAKLEKFWLPWLPHAGFFHFGTRNTPYESDERKINRMLQKFLAESQQPNFFKRYHECRKFPLPKLGQQKTEFVRVLLRRRTYRAFSPESLSLQSLSQLLFYTWGITAHVDTPLLGRLSLKTSPSAGARHPIEVYVLVLNVQGLAPGLYHYAPELHVLQQIRATKPNQKAVEYCSGQSWVRKAAALFIMTAVFPRVMWKYRTSRAYRTIFLDAGHLCQTFCLVATWLGLAPFCTLALKDSIIEKDLNLEGITESVIYVAGVGLPRTGACIPVVAPSRVIATL